MDAEVCGVHVDDKLRLTGPELRKTLEEHGPETFFAVVATSGTTNFGVVDDLASVAEVCREFGLWLHVDGAYGGAGLAAPSVRHLFQGIEHADSFIVDPHKWLFAPFDCCALIYREPELARVAHTQEAGYLDVITKSAEWNPTDYSIGLTRRARGLPLWYSLAVHGTDAYVEAIESTLEVTRFAADEIGRRAYLEAVREPDLSVVVFRRLGWGPAGLPGMDRPAAGGGVRVRRADDLPRRDADALRHRQPAHDEGGRQRHPRHDVVRGRAGVGVTGVTGVPDGSKRPRDAPAPAAGGE